MNRSISIAFAILTLVVVACAPTSGPLGTFPPGSASPEPSVGQGSPDVPPSSPTPTPSSGPGGSPTPTPSQGPGSTPSPTPTVPVATTVVRSYFYLDGGQGSAGLVAVLREVPETRAVARAAINGLIEGPNRAEREAGISSAVPEGTRLLGISIEDTTATIDLSREFESGGGSASTLIRLGQVVFTLTQFPTVDRVVLWIEGQPVAVFGSEGLILDAPQTRAMYRDLLPAIFVDRPAWGASIGNPARVTGLSNVFEATFRIAILDNQGRTLVDQRAMATCGTGCWGTFDVTLRYDVDSAQWGTLRVYDRSAMDGSPQDIRDYRVWLTP